MVIHHVVLVRFAITSLYLQCNRRFRTPANESVMNRKKCHETSLVQTLYLREKQDSADDWQVKTMEQLKRRV